MAKRKKQGDSSGGPGKGFYMLLGLVAAAGVAWLLLAGGGDGGGQLGPLTASETSVESDSGAAIVRGSPDAPVTLVEFADYQCSHCASFAGFAGRLLQRDYVSEGLVRWKFYDFPLSRQSNSIPAALAARCAAPQGRYWEMHDLLFANQTSWARDDSPRDRFESYAEEAGLDVEAWNECYSSREFIPEIMASRQYGLQRGVTGTPAIFIDGEKTRTYQYGELQGRIEEELEEARADAGDDTGGAGDTAEGDEGDDGGAS